MLRSSDKVTKHDFLIGKYVLPEKRLLKISAKIKIFEYLPLGSELKKQTGIVKDQYKFSEDQTNFNNSNREDGVKIEDDEIKDNTYYWYIGDGYKDLINIIYKFGSKEKYLHLTNFDNQKPGLKIIANKFLKQ